MLWIKKFNWWIELKNDKSIYLKYNNIFTQYHFQMTFKKNYKFLKKIFSQIYLITKLNFSHNWVFGNILKHRKFYFFCLCNIDQYFLNRKINFFNIKSHSKKNLEKVFMEIQFFNNIPFFSRLVFNFNIYLNSKINLVLPNLLGFNLKTYSCNLININHFIFKKKRIVNIFLLYMLKKLSLIGIIKFDENLFFFSIWKKNLIVFQNQEKVNFNFSCFLNILRYNSNS